MICGHNAACDDAPILAELAAQLTVLKECPHHARMLGDNLYAITCQHWLLESEARWCTHLDIRCKAPGSTGNFESFHAGPIRCLRSHVISQRDERLTLHCVLQPSHREYEYLYCRMKQTHLLLSGRACLRLNLGSRD